MKSLQVIYVSLFLAFLVALGASTSPAGASSLPSMPAPPSGWGPCTRSLDAAPRQGGGAFLLLRSTSCPAFGGEPPGGDVFLTAIDVKGKLVRDFGKKGYVAVEGSGDPRQVLTDSAGNVTLAGSDFILRLDSDGNRDESFGTDGVFRSVPSRSTTEAADGGFLRIIASSPDPSLPVPLYDAVQRVSSTGHIVTSFGDSGVVRPEVPLPQPSEEASVDGIVSLATAPDGTIYGVVFGNIGVGTTLYSTNGPYAPGLIRLGPDGHYDQGFGDSGVKYLYFGPKTSYLEPLELAATNSGAVLVGTAGDLGSCGSNFRVSFTSQGTTSGADFFESSFGCVGFYASPLTGGAFDLAISSYPLNRLRLGSLDGSGNLTESSSPVITPVPSNIGDNTTRPVKAFPSGKGTLEVGTMASGWCNYSGSIGPGSCGHQALILRFDDRGSLDRSFGLDGFLTLPQAICPTGSLVLRRGRYGCPGKALAPRLKAHFFGSPQAAGLSFAAKSRDQNLRIVRLTISLPRKLRLSNGGRVRATVGGRRVESDALTITSRRVTVYFPSSKRGQTRVTIARGSFVTTHNPGRPKVSVEAKYIGDAKRKATVRPVAPSSWSSRR